MNHTQNSDFSKDLTVIPRPYNQLSNTQRAYIDWKALGGMVYDADSDGTQGLPRKMPLSELAHLCGVTVDAFHQAKATLPNFQELVDQRRHELNGETRLEKMHTVWFLNAMKMKNWALTEAWLINFDPSYKTPKVKHEVTHEVGNSWAALMMQRRARKKQLTIEGEIVGDATDQSS